MKTHLRTLFLALIALCAVGLSPAQAAVSPTSSTFFSPAVYVGTTEDGYTVKFLDYFRYYTNDKGNVAYVYKFNFGWLYFFGGTGPSDNPDAYFYDFKASDVLYTAPELYPFFYSFNLNTFLYYLEDSTPRTFYDFDGDKYITY